METKMWISDYGYDETLHGFEKSARKLGVDRIDLLILHQALPRRVRPHPRRPTGLGVAAADGKVRAIGVSNFMVEHLDHAARRDLVVPAVNQIEVHPYFQQREVQAVDAQHGILTQAWSPIGGITFYRDGQHSSTLEDPSIGDIAAAHGKSAAQVMLRWHVQQGRSVIPKSTKPAGSPRTSTCSTSSSLRGAGCHRRTRHRHRGGPEPEAITLENFGRRSPKSEPGRAATAYAPAVARSPSALPVDQVRTTPMTRPPAGAPLWRAACRRVHDGMLRRFPAPGKSTGTALETTTTNSEIQTVAPPTERPHRRPPTLLAYFSKAGENYYYGDRIDLTVGNTQVVARRHTSRHPRRRPPDRSRRPVPGQLRRDRRP